MIVIYFILSLSLLYFSKTWLTKEISRLVHKLGGNRNTTIIFWSIVFLPGTVLHELSHFLVAAATGARTGKIEILPEFIQDESSDGVVLGSVQTQKLNLVQGFLVGVAPFVSGLIFLAWISSLLVERNIFDGISIFYLYLFFVVSNSFFPSWADIRQTLPAISVILVATLVFTILGVGYKVVLPDILTEYLHYMSLTVLGSSALNISISTLMATPRTLFTIHRYISSTNRHRS